MRAGRFAALMLAALLPAASTLASSLPWIEDDYGRALSAARAKQVPLFIEAWAPW